MFCVQQRDPSSQTEDLVPMSVPTDSQGSATEEAPSRTRIMQRVGFSPNHVPPVPQMALPRQ